MILRLGKTYWMHGKPTPWTLRALDLDENWVRLKSASESVLTCSIQDFHQDFTDDNPLSDDMTIEQIATYGASKGVRYE